MLLSLPLLLPSSVWWREGEADGREDSSVDREVEVRAKEGGGTDEGLRGREEVCCAAIRIKLRMS